MKPSLVWLVPATLALSFGLSGCNTIEGMGEDVSAVGGAMSDTSREVRKEEPAKKHPEQTARASASAD